MSLRHHIPRSARGEKGITLVELLVSMIILSVLTTMIIGVWIALQSSSANAISSGRAQEAARDAMSRLRREIRDAQSQREGQPLAGQPAIIFAGPNEIRFTTAFNDPGADDAGQILLTRYWYDGTARIICRQRDTNESGAFDSGDRTDVLARNVVNAIVPSAASPTPLFSYSYVDADGNVLVTNTMSDPARILNVHIRILADLNPGHSPTYMDLIGTAQPRNLRQT
jgi:type II secretory pathway pseudopilin PulG